MRKAYFTPKTIAIYIIILSSMILLTSIGSKATNVVSYHTSCANRTCIIIDAGHGGVDGGATSCTGALESAINLEIAIRLNDMLHLLGLKTQMIRTTDISVYTEGNTISQKKVSDLKERVRIVNQTENSLLVSIHQNYYSDERYSGAQVFFAPDNSSRELGRQLQSALVSHLNPGSRRQSKKADGIYLLRKINKPGILVECGFLSNPEEEAKLRNREYQLSLSCVIATSCSNYLSVNAVS